MAVDGKADITTSKLCAVESKLEKMTTNNDKRHDAVEKKVDAISSDFWKQKQVSMRSGMFSLIRSWKTFDLHPRFLGKT